MNLDKDLTTLQKLIQNGNRSKVLRCKYLCKILNYKILEKQNIKERLEAEYQVHPQEKNQRMTF